MICDICKMFYISTILSIFTRYVQHLYHYDDVIMGAMASQITSVSIVYSTVYSDADERKHQSSASLAFVRGIHRGPVNSPHKVTRKMFPFHDVIMWLVILLFVYLAWDHTWLRHDMETIPALRALCNEESKISVSLYVAFLWPIILSIVYLP